MKILVAHPQQQHSYMLVRALLKAGHDATYMTTVYGKPGSLTRFSVRILNGESRKKAESRYMPDFPDGRVVQRCEFLGLLSLLLLRIDKSKRCYNSLNKWIDRHFGRKVARFAQKGSFDAVVCYNEHAQSAFDCLKISSPDIIKILDVSASMKPYHAKLFLEDIEATSDLPVSRKKELIEYFINGMSEAFDEVADTDYFLVPSQHAADSLIYCGATPNRIICCQYGSYFDAALVSNKTIHNPMRFVYCGRASMAKGIHHLMNIFDCCDSAACELTVIGDYDNSDGFFTSYLEKHTFTGSVLKEKVKEIMSEQDVMVFPSLTDGMSLACIEGLSCGLPLITTTNNGASDFVDEGVNGFVLSPGDDEAMLEKVIWCVANPDEVLRMKQAAYNTGKVVSWSAYNERIAEAFNQIAFESSNI
ncbi:MAG: glycosyltransferase family 4 protein [Clostridia bacterium]